MKGLDQIKVQISKLKPGEFQIEDYKVFINSEAGRWHSIGKFKITNKDYTSYFSFSLGDVKSGCGSIAMYGTAGASVDDKDKEAFKTIFNRILVCLKYNGVGSITTTYGASYYEAPCYLFLIELGFQVVSEYSNWRHGGEKQRLLQLIIK